MANAALTPAMPRLSALFTPLRVALLMAVVVLSVVVPLFVGGRVTLQHLTALSWQHLTLLLLLLGAKWGLNALRCQLFLRANRIRFRGRDTLAIMWLYESAAESTPGGLGGPIAGWAMLRRRAVPATVVASMGLFILVLDVVAIIVLIATTLLAAVPLHQAGAPWQLTATLATLLMALALLWGMVRYRRQLVRSLGRLRRPGTAPWLPGGPVTHFLRLGRTVERMAALPRPTLLALLLASTGHWCCRLSILYLAIVAVGGYVSWADTFSIQIISGLTGMVVGLPGGFLGAEMTMTALLMPVMDIKAIATVILLWRLLTFHATLLAGALSLPWLAHHLLAPGELHAPWRR